MNERFAHLLSPLRIGNFTMRNRIVHAPMSVCYADDQGRASDAMVEHYARRAEGGVGMVILENLAINVSGRQMPKQPMLADESHVPGIRQVGRAIQERGALAIAQIVHSGRYAGPWERYEERPRLAPSAVTFELVAGRFVTPQEITLAEIEECISAFAHTTRLAREAGLDGVEIHGATGVLISQFMSPRQNRRQDSYGGSRENRLRFAVDVAHAVREAAGDGFLVGFHLFADELAEEDGASLTDAVELAKRLEAEGMDFILPMVGTFETLRIGRNSELNRLAGYQIEQIRAIKGATRLPVFANGGLGDPDLAEATLREGIGDAIGLARPLFADPDWAAKVEAGRPDEIRVCGCTQRTCYRTQIGGGVCESWPQTVKQRGFYGL
jgi:2,4-dienoyl-CoA reductase (NADPH2)